MNKPSTKEIPNITLGGIAFSLGDICALDTKENTVTLRNGMRIEMLEVEKTALQTAIINFSSRGTNGGSGR